MYSECLSVFKLAPGSSAENAANAFSSHSKYEKLAVVVQVLQTAQNLVISRCFFAEDGKEMVHVRCTCTDIVLLTQKTFVWWSLPNLHKQKWRLLLDVEDTADVKQQRTNVQRNEENNENSRFVGSFLWFVLCLLQKEIAGMKHSSEDGWNLNISKFTYSSKPSWDFKLTEKSPKI